MNCPICRRAVQLNKAGCFPAHRITDEHRHRWSFCEMSGKPGELAARAAA